jgi:HEAT repeat protein
LRLDWRIGEEMEDEIDIEGLINALVDEDAFVRDKAKKILAKMRGPDLEAVLKEIERMNREVAKGGGL